MTGISWVESSRHQQEVVIGSELAGAQPPGVWAQPRVHLSAAAFAGLLGFALMLLVMLPNLWALVAGAVVGGAAAAGTYGALAGRAQTRARRSAKLTSDQELLRDRLAAIDATVRSKSERLPPSSQGQLRMMVVGLEEIVDRWDALSRFPEHQDAVHRTINRHLPRTLELFLALPDTAKPRHASEFKAQVGLLAEGVAKTRDTLVSKNLQALQTNRWLIEESMTDPDEKLFRDHGL